MIEEHYKDRCPFCFSQKLGRPDAPSLGGGMYPVRECMDCGSQMAFWEVELNMPVGSGCLDVPRGHEKEDDDSPEMFRVEGIRPRMVST
jgi:hypothetical protein